MRDRLSPIVKADFLVIGSDSDNVVYKFQMKNKIVRKFKTTVILFIVNCSFAFAISLVVVDEFFASDNNHEVISLTNAPMIAATIVIINVLLSILDWALGRGQEKDT